MFETSSKKRKEEREKEGRKDAGEKERKKREGPMQLLRFFKGGVGRFDGKKAKRINFVIFLVQNCLKRYKSCYSYYLVHPNLV